MLIGQLVFHFRLEYQRQRRVCISAARIELKSLAQWRLGPRRGALLYVADTQLNVGIACLLAPFFGFQRIDSAGRNTASQAGQ